MAFRLFLNVFFKTIWYYEIYFSSYSIVSNWRNTYLKMSLNNQVTELLSAYDIKFIIYVHFALLACIALWWCFYTSLIKTTKLYWHLCQVEKINPWCSMCNNVRIEKLFCGQCTHPWLTMCNIVYCTIIVCTP